mmetsp:Transcript_6595/g.26841  ORF Transcript_6595/g.26841 Transcript_6595/m.26841 type:complete len:432 (+) Transcript_6595:610-1905(+)
MERRAGAAGGGRGGAGKIARKIAEDRRIEAIDDRNHPDERSGGDVDEEGEAPPWGRGAEEARPPGGGEGRVASRGVRRPEPAGRTDGRGAPLSWLQGRRARVPGVHRPGSDVLAQDGGQRVHRSAQRTGSGVHASRPRGHGGVDRAVLRLHERRPRVHPRGRGAVPAAPAEPRRRGRDRSRGSAGEELRVQARFGVLLLLRARPQGGRHLLQVAAAPLGDAQEREAGRARPEVGRVRDQGLDHVPARRHDGAVLRERHVAVRPPQPAEDVRGRRHARQLRSRVQGREQGRTVHGGVRSHRRAVRVPDSPQRPGGAVHEPLLVPLPGRERAHDGLEGGVEVAVGEVRRAGLPRGPGAVLRPGWRVRAALRAGCESQHAVRGRGGQAQPGQRVHAVPVAGEARRRLGQDARDAARLSRHRRGGFGVFRGEAQR